MTLNKQRLDIEKPVIEISDIKSVKKVRNNSSFIGIVGIIQ